MVEQGLTVGLGTDGAMSSDNLNLFEAMRFAALVGKVRFPHEPARWLGAQAAWNLATRGRTCPRHGRGSRVCGSGL